MATPTGADLASVTVNASTIGLAASWKDFTFDTPYTLLAGYNYAVLMGTSVDLLVGDKIEWGQDTGAGYASGLKCLSDDSGSSWVEVSSRDLTFRTYAGVSKVSSFEVSNSWQAVYSPYYLAQTFPVSQQYTITKVQLYCRRTTASPPGTVIVSIREVTGNSAGKATNPTPNNTATGVSPNLSQLTWTSGAGSVYDNVYFGPQGNMSLVDTVNITQSYALSSQLPLTYGATYEWRIDTVGQSETVTGDTWSFTALTLNPPDPATMKQIKRLVACADGKFWYENI
jgi:hypothetical protein